MPNLVDANNSSPRSFPFKAGTGYRPSDAKNAERALKVFGVLWEAVNSNQLTHGDIKDVYFYSISTAITYSESWKRGKFWSVSAWNQACENGITTGLVSEHVFPRGVTLEHALTLETVEDAKEFISKMSFECVITKDENQRLNDANLHANGSIDNPWKRYQSIDIKILDVQHPVGTFFLNDVERTNLSNLGLLVDHAPPLCDDKCRHCYPPARKTKKNR